MKKIHKILFIFMIVINLIALIYKVEAKDFWSRSENFLEIGEGKVGMLQEDKDPFGILNKNAKNGFQELIDFLWGIGLLVILIGGAVLGIRYMLVLPDEKSRIKQATFPYVIGVIIIFGALTIWKFIIQVLDGSL